MQLRNAEMVDLLRSDFQFRYEPSFAWKSACSIFQSLNGLRGFWPMSSVDENGDTFDLSGQGRILSDNGDLEYGYDDLAPYVNLDGTGDFLNRTDEAGLDILGTEAYIETPGLTLGGWFQFDRDSTSEGLIAKYDAATNNRSYLLYKFNTDFARFLVSNNGIAAVGVTSTVSLNQTDWYFIAGRFDPGAETAIFVNGTWDTNVAAIPASIFNSNADLEIGSYNTGTVLLQGRASLCFLCAAFLEDWIVNAIFQQTRAMYGV